MHFLLILILVLINLMDLSSCILVIVKKRSSISENSGYNGCKYFFFFCIQLLYQQNVVYFNAGVNVLVIVNKEGFVSDT